MEDFLRNKNLIHALKMISPGSPLRQGLDNILKAKTGGLIVIATGEEIMEVVDGGFCINAEYSPAYIYELAKMDGAIVLSSDTKKRVIKRVKYIKKNKPESLDKTLASYNGYLNRAASGSFRFKHNLKIKK